MTCAQACDPFPKLAALLKDPSIKSVFPQRKITLNGSTGDGRDASTPSNTSLSERGYSYSFAPDLRRILNVEVSTDFEIMNEKGFNSPHGLQLRTPIPLIQQNDSDVGMGGVSNNRGRKPTALAEAQSTHNVRASGLGSRSKERIADITGASKLWVNGIRGGGVRVAVFDTGLKRRHPALMSNVRERSNWTNEDTMEDHMGHGTFVAGVIGGSESECPGLAPDVDLFIFRVFTNQQVSFTSWFLDAFNYAMYCKVHVLNLSIGGPDFTDLPFVEKVRELSASGIILVSAIGNDGPIYGTLNNPADQADVIGVGGAVSSAGSAPEYESWLAGDSNRVKSIPYAAPFSSRGQTLWASQVAGATGRAKPDVLAFGQNVWGPRSDGEGCRVVSGTSVASPVVAGAVALLLSALPVAERHILNPARMKQVLISTARRLPNENLFTQGAGLLQLDAAISLVVSESFVTDSAAKASLFPAELNLGDCPYFWPYCAQPLFARSQPTLFNITVLNPLAVTGRLLRASAVWRPTNSDAEALEVEVDVGTGFIWPWSGWLGVRINVKEVEGVTVARVDYPEEDLKWEETTFLANGSVEIKLFCVPSSFCTPQLLRLPISAPVLRRPPPRNRRLLWDTFHSISYPQGGYIPRDSILEASTLLDLNGDLLSTNYAALFRQLRSWGYYLESQGEGWSCFDASRYGALLLVDSEEEFFPDEIDVLRKAVMEQGMGLVVVAEWFSEEAAGRARFFDENTRSWWSPVTGGANLPALNDLLQQFGVSFGGRVVSSSSKLVYDSAEAPGEFEVVSGTSVTGAPAGSRVLAINMIDDISGQEILDAIPVAVVPPEVLTNLTRPGAIAIFGDSFCLDSALRETPGLLPSDHAEANDSVLAKFTLMGMKTLTEPIIADVTSTPNRLPDDLIGRHSKVRKFMSSGRSSSSSCTSFNPVNKASGNLDDAFERENESASFPELASLRGNLRGGAG